MDIWCQNMHKSRYKINIIRTINNKLIKIYLYNKNINHTYLSYKLLFFIHVCRQLSQEKDKMAREIDLEKQKKKRLSCHNEELQWKLKKSTEVANHLAVSTKRLSMIYKQLKKKKNFTSFDFIGQTPQDLAAMKEAQNNYQKLCRESSNSENRYLIV